MKKASKSVPVKRKSYPAEFKTEALQLMERVCAKVASQKLGIKEQQLYAWKSANRRKCGFSVFYRTNPSFPVIFPS